MKICIESQDDGTYLVGEMDKEVMPESADGEMEQDMEEGMQPAVSIDDAFNIARSLLEADPRSEMEQVQAGYNKGKKPMMGGMGPAKVFGDE